MNALITNYRGFDIFFDTDNEKFTYSLDETSWHEKQSYKSVKNKIDEYLKDEANFKPFYIRMLGGKEIKVVGIRKDGRFVVDKGGKKEQLSQYYEKDYFIVKPEEEHIHAEYAMLGAEIESLIKKRDSLESGLTSLEDYKKNLNS